MRTRGKSTTCERIATGGDGGGLTRGSGGKKGGRNFSLIFILFRSRD
jgi:hypothetical protein